MSTDLRHALDTVERTITSFTLVEGRSGLPEIEFGFRHALDKGLESALTALDSELSEGLDESELGEAWVSKDTCFVHFFDRVQTDPSSAKMGIHGFSVSLRIIFAPLTILLVDDARSQIITEVQA